MNQYHCCIFDLDGTLVNTLLALQYCVNETMNHMGMSGITMEQTCQFVGDGAKTLMERSLKSCGDLQAERLEEALACYMKIFDANYLYQASAYPGIKELILYLKEKGCRLAVLSNKPHIQTIKTIEAVFEPGTFDYIAGEQAGIPKKPDPKGVQVILETLGVKPGQCLYFGDTNTDMKTGQAAGLDTVAVTWGFRDRSELEAFHPAYIIDHPQEIYHVF